MPEEWMCEMFETDREWLQDQPKMNPWERSCAVLAERLKRWLFEYSQPLCDHAVQSEHGRYRIYIGRMWMCWGYHWCQAALASPERRIAGKEVGNHIRSGKGYRGGGQLGGDPLRDIVLAVAMQSRDNRATEHFQWEHYDYLRRLAGKLNRRFYRDADDWWNDFLDFLAGYTKPPGKLERFEGRSALHNWLPLVLWNFLRRRLQVEKSFDELPDDSKHKGDIIEDPAYREYVELLAKVADAAIDDLSPDERLVLFLSYVEGVTLKQVAAILGIHSGNAGRRRKHSKEHLRRRMEDHADQMGCRKGYEECSKYSEKHPKAFAYALREALRKRQCPEGEL